MNVPQACRDPGHHIEVVSTRRAHPCRATTDHLHIPILPATPAGNPSVEWVFLCVSPLRSGPSFSSLLATMATTNAAPPGRRATTATPRPGCWYRDLCPSACTTKPARTGALVSQFFSLIFPAMSKGSSTRGHCLHAMRKGGHISSGSAGHPILAVGWHLPCSLVAFL